MTAPAARFPNTPRLQGPHARRHPLLSTIIGGIVLAFVLGTIAQLRLPPLVGYLCAG